jgi:hypothetical protein
VVVQPVLESYYLFNPVPWNANNEGSGSVVMRAGLLLPACIVVSALAHVLLVAAVAVPRKGATSHGETVNVDIVPASEVPDLPEVPESAPPEPPPPPVPDQQAQPAAAPPPSASQQTQQQKPQAPRQQAQQQPQQQAQPQQPPPQQQQASQPLPDQPAPATPAPGSTLAEQHERLTAMLNLPGPGAGDGSGAEAHLTEQERAAFKAHLKSCWQLPEGVGPNQKLKVIVRMSLKQNGSLTTDPQLIEAGISPIGPSLVQAAMKAIKQCAPYTMLPAAKYKEWRILDMNFSPDEMTRI